MLIVNQTRSEITNFDNVTHINVDDGIIVAYLVTGSKRVLGNYETNRGAEVFAEMLSKCFPAMIYEVHGDDIDPKLCFDNPPKVVVTNTKAEISNFDCGVYYMPEN
ncbi:MAG: hypothetical protein IKN54_02345 [Lachnospiraceae bacterium]|nr:hypothetical protein [Lachnospiraceae bacterium]